jgi:carbon storage regulator
MLVLSRRRGESIIVGDDIEIRVLEVHGSQVKIGIQAPSKHTIHRKEVYLAIHDKGRVYAPARRSVSPGYRDSPMPPRPSVGDIGASS